MVYRTDPRQRDTDRDGLSDGDEVLKYGTDPLTPDSLGDGTNDFWRVVGAVQLAFAPPPWMEGGAGLALLTLETRLEASAGVAALRVGRSYAEPYVRELASIRDIVFAELNALRPLARVPAADGAFYALMKVETNQAPLALAGDKIHAKGPFKIAAGTKVLAEVAVNGKPAVAARFTLK